MDTKQLHAGDINTGVVYLTTQLKWNNNNATQAVKREYREHVFHENKNRKIMVVAHCARGGYTR